jgi:hypothetical protein
VTLGQTRDASVRGQGAIRLPAAFRDGRLVLVALLACYFLALLALSLESNAAEAWRRFGVFSLDPSFADMRSVTSAWECTRAGIDVVPGNPCDPWGRPANYPSLWLAPAFLGLGQESTAYLGVATALVFFGSFLLLIGPARPLDAVIYAAALCSPAVMLGVERGNVDLLLFALVALGVLLLRRTWVLAHGLLLAAAVLKLFPVFAWGVVVRQPRRRVFLGGGALALVLAAYALATLGEIRAILDAVPQETQSSYGAGVAVESLQDLVSRLELTPLYFLTHPSAEPVGRVVLVCAGGLLGLWLARRWRSRDHAAADRHLDAFWAGAGIFCGTFALFQNYDYRLIFLLLTVPQLLRWAHEARAAVPLAGWALAGILATLWLGTGVPFAPFGLGDAWVSLTGWFPLEEVVNWLLFAYFAAALVVTFPQARWSATENERSARSTESSARRTSAAAAR